jgi:hypothetical protein
MPPVQENCPHCRAAPPREATAAACPACGRELTPAASPACRFSLGELNGNPIVMAVVGSIAVALLAAVGIKSPRLAGTPPSPSGSSWRTTIVPSRRGCTSGCAPMAR